MFVLALYVFTLTGLLGMFIGFTMLSEAKLLPHEIEAAIFAGFGLVAATVATTGLVLRSELRSLRERIISAAVGVAEASNQNTQANR